MLAEIKDKKFEIVILLILIALSWLGHYYLSWKDIFTGNLKLAIRFTWMVVMVTIGFYGLTRHEIVSVKYIWVVWYILLFTGFIIDKVIFHFWGHAQVFGIASYQFTSPFSYIVACILPRIIKAQLKKYT